MTKKAEKAARVEANKRAAYVKKVLTLLGHVLASRATIVEAVNAAYSTGEDALFVAATIASREPVGRVVHPLKVESVAAAEKWALERAAEDKVKLEAIGFDLDEIAPRPDRKMGASEYEAAKAKRSRWSRFLRTEKDSYGTSWVWDKNLVARFVQHAKEDAAAYYDGFICKLVDKVGPVDSAELDGSHVWSHSILTVRKGATVERWKTQQIENVSVLGKYFPQWPTRLIKEGGK